MAEKANQVIVFVGKYQHQLYVGLFT